MQEESKPGIETAADGPGRVLLVEDEILIRMDLAETFDARGWAVVEAGTADEAIGILSSDPAFTLLLTDVHMPGERCGLDLAKWVRDHHPSIRVVVMSGQHLPSPDEHSLCDLFIAKPFGDLMAAIDLLVRQASGQGEPA